MRKYQTAAPLIAMLLLATASKSVLFAGPLEDGFAAQDRGDDAMALKIWEPLAEQGNGTAQMMVGMMYSLGQGVPQDQGRAIKWLEKAAEQGVEGAAYLVATQYEGTADAPEIYARAYKWYYVAGTPNGLKRVATKMTPKQIDEATRLAKEWLAAHPAYIRPE